MTQIKIMGELYEWETTIDNRTIRIKNTKTGAWTAHSDDLSVVGDSSIYDNWEDWIYDNWDDLIWMPGDQE